MKPHAISDVNEFDDDVFTCIGEKSVFGDGRVLYARILRANDGPS